MRMYYKLRDELYMEKSSDGGLDYIQFKSVIETVANTCMFVNNNDTYHFWILFYFGSPSCAHTSP